MTDLGIDITTWGKFDKETYNRLTDYLYNLRREGYRSLPEVVFVTIDQKHDILAYVDDNELPIARQVEPGFSTFMEPVDKQHEAIYTFTLSTPLTNLWVRTTKV